MFILELFDCKRGIYTYPTFLLMHCFVAQLLTPIIPPTLSGDNCLYSPSCKW